MEETGEGEPRPLVLENARRKTAAVPGPLVLGVDTTVALEGRCHGKPRDADEAAAMLEALAGREHEVWSAIALRDGLSLATATARTVVRFRALRADQLAWYVATDEWRGRAGGYAIQERGAALVESIDGDFWNVVGLPVAALMALAPELVMAR